MQAVRPSKRPSVNKKERAIPPGHASTAKHFLVKGLTPLKKDAKQNRS